MTDVLVPEKRSVIQSGSNLELQTIVKWVPWVSDSLLVDVPALVKAIMAVPPSSHSVVVVSSSMDIKALSSVVSDGSSSCVMPLDPLVILSSPDSDNS